MHRGELGDQLRRSLATAAVLVDGVRLRVYQAVRLARRPVTRDDVAAAAHVSRKLAAFHLDKLVEAGLLRVAEVPPSPARRVGRRPKVYQVGPTEVHVDVPQRQLGLLAGVLVELLAEESDDVRRAALDAAYRSGEALGRAGSGGVPEAVAGLGFEPYVAEPGVVRLANCPFQPLAARSPELVCRLNHSLLAGLVAGLGDEGVRAVLAPRPGECCVELRRRRPEDDQVV